MTSLLAKVTFVVTEIILLGDDIRFLMVKISVAAEITFKVDVTISSVAKLTFVVA